MRERMIRSFLIAAVSVGALFLGRVLVKAPDIGVAIIAGLVPALVCAWLTVRGKEDSRFLLRLFTAALILRWLLASIIFYTSQQAFFGGDSITYDAFGYSLSQSWHGVVDANAYWLIRFTSLDRPGWGMYYFVAAIYYVIGQNQFALQLINGALGAG